MNKKDKNILSSTPSNPDNKFIEAEATGVKDQNLYLQNATLNIDGNLNIEDEFNADSLTVKQDVNSDCDFFIGGNLSGENGFSLQETILNGDITVTSSVTSNSQTQPLFSNVSDPLSQRDALTFNYYKKHCVQAYTCFIDYRGRASLDANSLVYLKTNTSKDFENYTPMYRNYFNVDTRYIQIRTPGIYQVSFELTRIGGQHSGNDEVNLFLRLNSGPQYQNLCIADTRGHYNTDRTSTSLYAIFSVTDVKSSDLPTVSVYTGAHILCMFSSVSVIWFPFPTRFSEED
ncbi:hypothetical protein [Chlamydia caviae]|uniref:C1q domain-containing protein n=1 Tax=Chlamydia caviae (strain ATCC VR-813 / DSM 19441 / 03DC25 / GPIC) TaxID=227941 RepID=Q823A2_CHLCV|nr:hypothetical protein [Chlamydia caviae]AAP05267.1 conserved hypothetical protein [Chlamydia caviae GPIC]